MKLRLKGRTVVLILLFATFLGAVALIASTLFMNRIIDEHYREDVDTIAHLAAVAVDADAAERLTGEVMGIYAQTEKKVPSSEWGSNAFKEYLSHYRHVEETEDFTRIRSQLKAIQDNSEASSVYLFTVNAEDISAIYIVDAAEGEDNCPPGCIDEVFFDNYAIFEDPEKGFDPYISDTEEYGFLVTAAAPIHNVDGQLVCYAGADIPMELIRARRMRFRLLMAGLLLLGTIVIVISGVLIIDRNIVGPVKRLSEAAQRYCEVDSNAIHDKFASLEVHTGDEIEMLADSMKQMERDLNDHIAKMVETRSRLVSTMREAEKMGRIATMDSLTGIRNKTAYDSMVQKIRDDMAGGNDKIGVAMIDLNNLKKINDSCGHEKGDQAIRHLCQLVCATYQHSPVFRIGGDEFVVILRGRDYENEKALTEKLNQTLDALSRDGSREPWERISAAVGSAFFDPALDHGYDDLFARADANMYERKKEMKAGRA